MTITIQERLQADMKDAMRSGETQRRDVIRSARAALQAAQLEAAKSLFDRLRQEIETRLAGDPAAIEAELGQINADAHAPLDPQSQEAVIAKEIKRRRDAAEAYRNVGREDRAQEEDAEARILEVYLPKQLSADELRPAIAAIIAELGINGSAALGKLMPVLMERFKGRAEGRIINQVARELLK